MSPLRVFAPAALVVATLLSAPALIVAAESPPFPHVRHRPVFQPVSATQPRPFTVDGPNSITASFDAFSLTTLVSPTGAGTVTRTPNQTLYNPGAKVALGAQAIPGYLFSSWSGDLTGVNNPDTVLMNTNKTVTANFILSAQACGGWQFVPTASQPPARQDACSIWDPVRHRMLVYGGRGQQITPVFSDTWGLTVAPLAAWTQVDPGGGGPGGRFHALSVYDPVRDRLLIYSGTPDNLNLIGDVWALTLAGTPAWTQVIGTTGTFPTPRNRPSVIYDPPRDRLLLFGGKITCGPFCEQYMNDVWQLDLSGTPAWTQLSPSGTPPAGRYGHGVIYDPARDRMVVFGGSSLATDTNGAWALSLSGTMTWTNLNPTGAPHAYFDLNFAYDPIRDRVLAISQDGSQRISSLDFSNRPNAPFWCQMYPLGPDPGVRVGQVTAYDPDDDLVLLSGGAPTVASPPYTNSLRLDLSGGLFLDTSGINGVSIGDKWCYGSGETATLLANAYGGNGFDSWGGDASGTSNPTTLTMNAYKIVQARFSSRATGMGDVPIAFALEVRPNPAVGPAEIEYSLPRAANVRLRVFDVAGREVERLADGTQPAGRHVIRWGEGRQLRAGIYVIRFDTPAGAWTKRLALLR